MTDPTALIIIDMQRGMLPANTPPRNNPKAEDNIAALLEAWRQNGRPLVHVRHMSRSPQGSFWPGSPAAEFQDRFVPLPHEHRMEKNVPDAFCNSGLERWLLTRGIHRLAIVGVSTNNSVEATARSAGNLGFATAVASDACFTFDKTDYEGTLRQAADWHRTALSNLDGEYATIETTEALLRAL
jgi:nicotinamidase-related amidase